MRALLLGLTIVCLLPAHAQNSPAQIPAAHFATLNGYTDARISPDGKHLAFLYPVDERNYLVVRDVATGENLMGIPPQDGADFWWLRWANDETLVFTVMLSGVRVGGIRIETEETRLAALNIGSREITSLAKPAEITGTTGSRTARSYYPEIQIQHKVIDWMPDEPDHILLAVDEDQDNRYEVRKVNVNTGDYRIHRRSIEGIQDWVVDAQGEIRLGTGVRLGEERVVFRDAEGEWLALEQIDWFKNGWEPYAFTEDPEVIYVYGFGEHGTRELRKLNTQTGEFVETIFQNDTYDVASFLRHPVTNQLVGYGYYEHAYHYVYFDDELRSLQASVDRVLPDSSNYIRSVTPDLRKVVIESKNAKEPGMVVLWDRDAKSLEPVGWFNEHLDPEMMADVSYVEFPSADGTIVPGYLTLPKGKAAENLPAVVLPHGGPTARDGEEFWFLSQFLASRGYAVLQPNFRGSSGYGVQWRDAGRGQWGGIMQDDVDAGGRWLAEQGIADPARICIAGWSYGGYSAAMGLVSAPDLYKCAVGINGVYNLPQIIADSNEYVGGTIWTRHIGLDGERTRSVSPHHRVEDIKAPVLLIHADDDHRVRIKHAIDFYNQLEGAGKEAKLVRIAHGGHSMVNAKSRQQILEEMEAFLADNIGNAN